MIKVSEKVKKVDTIGFPKLMTWEGMVVLMTQLDGDHTGRGVVVKAGGEHQVGYYCEYWGMGFVDYTGTIELSNDVG